MTDYLFQDRQKEHWALLSHPSPAGDRGLAIFIHGFWGNHLTTWGKLPEFLATHAADHEVLRGWDFLFLGYVTRDVASYLDIATPLANQWQLASVSRAPYRSQYTRLALFGHSLGTLGIRQLLCATQLHPIGMLQALHSVTLFGSPINGSPLALPSKVLGGGPIADALRPKNPQLRMLKTWVKGAHQVLKWRDVRLVFGADDKVVGDKYRELIEFAGDVTPHAVYPLHHRSLVKPPDWTKSALCDEVVGALQ